MDVSPQLPALESLKLAKEVASPHVALVPSCASEKDLYRYLIYDIYD